MKIDKIYITGFFLSLFLFVACGSDNEPSIPEEPDPYSRFITEERACADMRPSRILERCTGEFHQSSNPGYRK